MADLEVPISTAAEEHRRVCGCRLCSQRDHVEVHVWSCGVVWVEFGSSTQSVRALSTGESEFYAITKGSAHSLHSQAILKGFVMTVEAVLLSDASAGMGIASRQVCGRLEVKWLWVQEKVSEKALRLKKHPTETNIADLATKYL